MIEQVFNNHLDAIEHSFNLSIPGSDAADRLEHLHRITRDDFDLSRMIRLYSAFVNEKNTIELSKVSYDSDLRKNVAEILFLRFLSGAVHIYPRNDAPKTHHWLPVVYIKGFSNNDAPSKKRKVRTRVDAVSFHNERMLNAMVEDTSFAHDREGDNGFYDLSVEAFFGGLESNLARAKGYLNENSEYDGLTAAYIASFFIVQSVRNPHPYAGFASGEFKTVVHHVMNNFTNLGEIYVNFGSSAKKLPFSPYVPDRVRVQGTTKSFYFPVDSHHAAIISNAPISQYDISSIISQFRKNTIRFAKKNNKILFGINSSEI